MSIQKVKRTFRDITTLRLTTSSRLNLYNILKDTVSDTYFVNIFRNFKLSDSVKTDNKYFIIHVAENDEWWDNISSKYYGIPNYWYIICEMNNILNPYEDITEGQNIKVLKESYLYDVFKGIKEVSEL